MIGVVILFRAIRWYLVVSSWSQWVVRRMTVVDRVEADAVRRLDVSGRLGIACHLESKTRSSLSPLTLT